MSQSIRVAAMALPWMSSYWQRVRCSSNVPPMRWLRKGRAWKPTGWQTSNGRIPTDSRSLAARRQNANTRLKRGPDEILAQPARNRDRGNVMAQTERNAADSENSIQIDRRGFLG